MRRFSSQAFCYLIGCFLCAASLQAQTNTGRWSCSGSVSLVVNGSHFDHQFNGRGDTEDHAWAEVKRQCNNAEMYGFACESLRGRNCKRDPDASPYADGFPHFYWCGTQEGVRFFDSDGKARPPVALRNECMGKESHPGQEEARSRVSRMTDEDIRNAVAESERRVLVDNHSNEDLLYHMTWCMHDDADTNRKLKAFTAAKAWESVRHEYWLCQNHNPSVVNLPSVVPNAVLGKLVSCTPDHWPYYEDHSSCVNGN